MLLQTPFVFLRFLLEVQQPSGRVSTKQLGPDAIAFFVQLFGRAPELPENAVGHCQRDFSFPEKTSAAPAFCMNSVWARKSARATT